MINLKPIFQKLEKETYSIIKISNDFPKCKVGSDIDILGLNIENIAKIIIQSGNDYIDKGYTINFNDTETQIKIDFILNTKIILRFDLYKKLPLYENINIKPALFESIIENSISKIIEKNFIVYIPNIIDDLVIRYIEYNEWYGVRPDKIKHIDYINQYITDSKLKNKFLDKIHHYTAFSHKQVKIGNKKPLAKKKYKIFWKKIKNFLKKNKS